MSFQTVLAAGTAAADGTAFTVERSPIAAYVTGALLGGADTIPLQYSTDGGTTWLNLFDYTKGAAVAFSATISALVIDAPGTYRFRRTGVIGTSSGVDINDYPTR